MLVHILLWAETVKCDDEIPVVNIIFGYSHMKLTDLEEHGDSGTGQRYHGKVLGLKLFCNHFKNVST